MTMRIRVVQLGKGVVELDVSPGTTVADGLAAAGITATRMEVRVRGSAIALDQPLAEGDLVTVIPLIKGGG